MAYVYSNLFRLPTIGLRFFTVYGPWGRPDMAPMIFANAMVRGEKIKVFNNGIMKRDFTYIDDVVESIVRCCFKKNLTRVSENLEISGENNKVIPIRFLILDLENQSFNGLY